MLKNLDQKLNSEAFLLILPPTSDLNPTHLESETDTDNFAGWTDADINNGIVARPQIKP